MHSLRSFYRAVLRHRVMALALLLAVTLALGWRLLDPGRLYVDFSLDALLVPDAQAQAQLERLDEDFGDEVGLVAVVIALPRDGPRTVFDEAVLAAIDELRGWLLARPEIDAAGVVTLLDLADLRGRDITPEALRAPPEERARLAASLVMHRSYRDLFIAADQRATLVLAPFAVHAADLRLPLLDALRARAAALQHALGPGAEAWLAGVPLVQATYARTALGDVALLVPLTIALIALLLGLAFRRAHAVVGPLAAVGLATICTLGLIQALGLPFDIVNSVAGVAILVIGVAEGAHIVARHREEVLRLGSTADPRDAIVTTMAQLTPACFVTSATTAVGFGSLMTAELPAIVAFGAVMAAGVMMTWAIQMVLMPIVLSFAARRTRPSHLKDTAQASEGTRLERWLGHIADAVTRRPLRVVLVALVLAVVSGIGALRLRADARAVGELAADHPVARGMALMEERLAGVLVHAVAIAGRDAGGAPCLADDPCAPGATCRRIDYAYRAVARLREAVARLTDIADERLFLELEARLAGEPYGRCTWSVATPAVMALLHELDAWIAADGAARRAAGRPELIGRSASVVDALIDLGRGEAPTEDPGLLAERLGVLESGAPALVGRYLTPDHTRTQLLMRADDIGLAAWRDFEPRLSREIERLIERHGLAERVTVVISGPATLAERALSGIGDDLIGSLGYDIALILLFIVALTRSVRLGLLAMVPNLLPLLVTLGAMGFADMPIRASTIIVFSVALGIAVDDTTHFVHRYQEEVRFHGEGAWAIRRTLVATGRPILWSALILIAGFLVNGLSDFKAIVEFGVLSAVTLGLALVTEIVLTPALLMLARGRLGGLHARSRRELE